MERMIYDTTLSRWLSPRGKVPIGLLSKNNIILLYPLQLTVIPPTFILPVLALLTPAPVASEFAPSAPLSNLNPQAPTIGIRVVNGLPEKSVASATLTSVPYLPPAAMQGHVMPSFPHTLIGLGPFSDLGCAIMFTKTDVTVIDPYNRCILKGWRERSGPQLWCFPLQATKPSLPVPALHENHD
jgi:hypothetical protein